ncbi:hypothetical protein ACIBP6_46745 [Nonomuraea terrae]|uniref:hypothetical protein n=1 Tax=Nonomuraea terrae TaxID=2530383 RepID=UPI0037A514D9
MKRILAGVALTTAAALATAAPAQAAPADPVKAMQKQFVPGHGVRFTESTSVTLNGKSTAGSKTSGTLEFGKSGIVASDVTNKGGTGLADVFVPPRSISVGGNTYAQGGLYSEDLPDGKKWVRYTGQAATGSYNQLLDVFEPKVLKALVAKAKSFKGGTYKGGLTYGELGKLSGQKVTGTTAKIKIEYALSVDSKGRVTRISSGYTADYGILGKYRAATDTRFTGWGSKVSIKAPAESLWIDVEELTADTEVPQAIPDSALATLGG